MGLGLESAALLLDTEQAAAAQLGVAEGRPRRQAHLGDIGRCREISGRYREIQGRYRRLAHLRGLLRPRLDHAHQLTRLAWLGLGVGVGTPTLTLSLSLTPTPTLILPLPLTLT